MLKLRFAKLREDTKLPYRASETAACYDCFCPDDVAVQPGETKLIPLNFAVECPDGYKLCVYNRSGLGKKGLVLPNGVGIIDQDYRGNVGAMFFNSTSKPYKFNKGDRICQLALEKVNEFEFEVVEYSELSETERGDGGFGHSGK